ncbi:hypothetical protein ES703_89381 [subsurface metagenome]
MPKPKRKTDLQDALDTLAGFRDLVDETFEKFTGKSIAAWLREFQERPRELPGGEQAAPQQEPAMPLADAYAILGLKPDAPLEDVKKHYRQLAMVFHSDRGGMNDEAMKLLNRAFERITKGKKE